jgi:multidrug resistance efflux pump
MSQTVKPLDDKEKETHQRRAGRSWMLHIPPILITCAVVAVAVIFAWAMWDAYEGSPWTRDGTVRAYVTTATPQVSGLIVKLPIVADQHVRKGDLLMEIDPTDFQIAVSNAEALVAQAKANFENRRAESERRLKLTSLAVTAEEQETFVTQAQVAEAAYKQNLANLDQARVNLSRTRIVSPVNGYITNLLVQTGDYATAGQKTLAIVDRDSFWIEGYFEETLLENIHIGDPARVALMGYTTVLKGHVVSIARGISVPNAQSDSSGLASVNPIFTWIRLAQRIPVRIVCDDVPPEVTLAVGLTATIEIVTSDAANGRFRPSSFLRNIAAFFR